MENMIFVSVVAVLD